MLIKLVLFSTFYYKFNSMPTTYLINIIILLCIQMGRNCMYIQIYIHTYMNSQLYLTGYNAIE